MVARTKRKKLPNGRVIKFRRIDGFINNNNGIRAVAYQDGGTYAMLASNGNCTPFFNSDEESIRQFLGNAKPVFIPVK